MQKLRCELVWCLKWALLENKLNHLCTYLGESSCAMRDFLRVRCSCSTIPLACGSLAAVHRRQLPNNRMDSNFFSGPSGSWFNLLCFAGQSPLWCFVATMQLENEKWLFWDQQNRCRCVGVGRLKLKTHRQVLYCAVDMEFKHVSILEHHCWRTATHI